MEMYLHHKTYIMYCVICYRCMTGRGIELLTAYIKVLLFEM